MNIFSLVEWSWDGNSYSLWSHKTKLKEQFSEDCKWILKTHLDLLLVDQIEEDGKVWRKRIGSEECIELIQQNLPKLGYEKVETTNFGIQWANKMEDKTLFTEEQLEKIKQHNK